MIEFASEPLVFIRTENVWITRRRANTSKSGFDILSREVRENKKAASRARNDEDK